MSGPRRRLVAALAAAALIAAVLAVALSPGGAPRRPRPVAAPGFEVALQDNAVFLQRDYYDRERAFAQARALGVGWLRVTLLWSRAAAPGSTAAAPAWAWGPYDDVVGAAAAHGIHVEFTLTGPAPAYATADHRVGVVSPDAASFGDFARAAAEHFRGRVSRYSIWNEPNYLTWLAPQVHAAALYRALYLAGSAAVRAGAPGAQVLIGETAGPAQPGRVIPALRFLRAVTCRDAALRPLAPCARLTADGYAHHPYDFGHPPAHAYPGADDVTLGSLGRLFRQLDALAHAGALSTPDGRPLPVYLTEFGYMAHGPLALPEPTRAAYLRSAFELAAGRYPRVRQLLQYLLVAPPAGFPGGSFDPSLVSAAGTPSAAFGALSAWARSAAAAGRLERAAP